MSKVSDLNDNDNFAIAAASTAAGFEVSRGKFVVEWSVDEVIEWLQQIGFQDVVSVFGAHTINGHVLGKLTDSTLKEMGIQSVGRRLALHNEILKVQSISRAQWRSAVLWTMPEYRTCCIPFIPYGFPCCCSFVVGSPLIYKLTNAKVIYISETYQYLKFFLMIIVKCIWEPPTFMFMLRYAYTTVINEI